MDRNDKYKRYSGLMLFLLLIVGISSAIIVPHFNFVSKAQGLSQDLAQTPPVTSVESIETGEVQAATTEEQKASKGFGKCMNGSVCDYVQELTYQPVCSINDAGGSMTGGDANEGKKFVSVRMNAKVEPFIITVPQVLLQGSKYVEDDRKLISKDYPVYRDSQHVILDDEARRTCAPGVDCADYDELSKRPDVPFSLHAFMEVKNADEGGFGGDGKAVIYSLDSLRSACPKVQKAKANPKKAGFYAAKLDVKHQAPGVHETWRDFGGVECYRTNPNGMHLQEAKNFVSCVTEVKPTDFVVSAVYNIAQWLECLDGGAECEEYRVFAIRLDAMFGGVFKCAGVDCEIRFFDFEKLKTTAPGDAQEMIPDYIDKSLVNPIRPVTEPYYLTTPCKIRINKWGIHNVPCLWDISPYQRHYEVQRSALMPLEPTMPLTFDDYWNNGVAPELKKRSLSCV